ncbi:hypothetical protein HUG10_20955 (plasmid) [Halorarum halophilum]|uniref:Uncharacterized protein n=1 Tax=Halorarum halophilum TaxID=2743090 RepID=A0A7D5KGT1_9EURY|nr:hypothetical protein [Halobaculum halophilum]QLG30057.1 hypothetical protein HUG10_20955 [Halobaculum halophilum]
MSLILPTAVERLERRGFRVRGSITDDDGMVGMWLSRRRQHYVVVAKRYAHRGKASFITRAVEAATEWDMYLVFYRADENDYTVFAHEIVDQYGADSDGPSKKGPATWRELSLRYGIALDDHLDGGDPFTDHELSDISDDLLRTWS